MLSANQSSSLDTGGTPVYGLKADIFERHQELVWMSKEDIEHIEARIADKTLFQNCALVLFSGAAPLLVEKLLEYYGSYSPIDLAIIVICVTALIASGACQLIARKRQKNIDSYKNRIFRNERLVGTTFSTLLNNVSSSRVHEGPSTRI